MNLSSRFFFESKVITKMLFIIFHFQLH